MSQNTHDSCYHVDVQRLVDAIEEGDFSDVNKYQLQYIEILERASRRPFVVGRSQYHILGGLYGDMTFLPSPEVFVSRKTTVRPIRAFKDGEEVDIETITNDLVLCEIAAYGSSHDFHVVTHMYEEINDLGTEFRTKLGQLVNEVHNLRHHYGFELDGKVSEITMMIGRTKRKWSELMEQVSIGRKGPNATSRIHSAEPFVFDMSKLSSGYLDLVRHAIVNPVCYNHDMPCSIAAYNDDMAKLQRSTSGENGMRVVAQISSGDNRPFIDEYQTYIMRIDSLRDIKRMKLLTSSKFLSIINPSLFLKEEDTKRNTKGEV